MQNQRRRAFLQKFLSGTALMTLYPWLIDFQDVLLDLSDDQNDEKYWKKVRKQYSLNKKIIDLNNAGVNPQAKVVQDAVAYYEKKSNELPSHYLWRILEKDRTLIKESLAELMGCQSSDLAIQRNTTEAMETVIFGMPLKKGDEVVLSKYVYPHMKFAWQQREHRDDIKLKWVDLKLPSDDPEYITSQFKKQIGNKTKVVCITHITNWNGQVLPIKEISAYAKSKGADVLVDAAHTLGQRPINLANLNIDYLASSLHKWLGAPFGTGVLYIKKGKRKDIYPLFAGPRPDARGMNKFEHLGTRALSHERAIVPAVVFCNSIGIAKKRDRLQYLKMYIVDRIKDMPKIKILSPTDVVNGSAILLLNIKGKGNTKLVNSLYQNWNIHCTKSEEGDLKGIRISPNVFTSTSELDIFIDSLHTLAT